MSKIEELVDRVERLLLRHGELQRTNALLEQQLATVTHERDKLRSPSFSVGREFQLRQQFNSAAKRGRLPRAL